MTSILYHGEPNGPSLSVIAAAFETGVEVVLQRIDLVAGDRHGAAVPHAMEVDQSIEGEGPTDPYARWQMMAWCRYVIERLAPAAAYLGLHAAPPVAVPAGIASIDLAERWRDAVEGRFDEPKLTDSHAKVSAAAEKIEAQLADARDWLMGEFGIADLETYAWLAGMPALVPAAFADKPLTASWLARVAARPSVVRTLALASVPSPERIWAPGPEINRWG
jgi:GST-like protein